MTETLYLRDHLVTQLDRADALPATPDGEQERRERLTVVAVGAGYTGAEVVAQLRHWTHKVASRWGRIKPCDVRWLLILLALPQRRTGSGSPPTGYWPPRCRRRSCSCPR